MKEFTVLIVERTEADIGRTRACLTPNSLCNVIGGCCDCRQAFAFIRLHHPDLVICEIVLYGLDGLWLLHMLAQDEERPLFLLTSSLTSDAILQNARDNGADYFLLKPYTAQQLQQTVQMLSQQHMRTAAPSPTSLIEHHIYRLLIQAGFSSHTCGFHYLASGILLCSQQPDLLSNLTKDLYQRIAQQYHTLPTRVERDIRHAIRTTSARTGMQAFSNGTALRFFLRALQQTHQRTI